MNNTEYYRELHLIVKRQLMEEENKNYTFDQIRNVTNQTLSNNLFKHIKKEDFQIESFCNDLLEVLTIQVEESSILEDNDDHIEWYNNNIERPFWDSHKRWLIEIKNRPVEVVNSLDRSTDDVIKRLENPKRDGSWDRRGLVVGSVQSGKTSHFIALINKAYDAGYKKIVLLSGMTNELRRQTHIRIDQGVIGENTSYRGISESIKYINLPLKKQFRNNKDYRIFPYTSSDINGDYKLSRESILTDTRMILCIKKNKSILEQTIRLFERDKEDEDGPILVIDDEVDQASVDTGSQSFNEWNEPDPEYDPKTINRLIRKLLHIHKKKCFIGYTATPMANIFIHDKARTDEYGPDLFPRNFIIDLGAPSNYFGFEKVFAESEDGSTSSKHIKNVTDHCQDPEDLKCKVGWMPPLHKTNHIPISDDGEVIPPSLRQAIYEFIIVSTLRNLRGHFTDHKSMLIHVSRLTDVNRLVRDQVYKELENIKSILNNPGENDHAVSLYKFKLIYNDLRKSGIDKEFSFEDIINHKYGLKYVVAQASVNLKLLTNKSSDNLDYEEFEKKGMGLITIAIGGDKLSRGITLEGLSTSYYLRPSKMYDTLMQMSRWLGYRDGYEDLVRLYTTDDLVEWLEHISKAIQELRIQFRVMANSNDRTPKNFGLKVKSHPLLMVTSNLKMRHGTKIKTNFIDHFNQTTSFELRSNLDNYNYFSEFLTSLAEPDESGIIKRNNLFNASKSYVWKNIDSSKVIQFLNSYKHRYHTRAIDPKYYAQFIKKMNTENELINWTVGLMGNGSSKNSIKIIDKYEVALALRKPRDNSNADVLSIGVLTDPMHEALDLNDDQLIEVINKSNSEKIIPAHVRQARSSKNGLILFYPILTDTGNKEYDKAKKNDEEKIYDGTPTVGFAISFPSTTNTDSANNTVDYVVNNVYNEVETRL